MESMGVASACGCKEVHVYRFPHNIPTYLVSALFCSIPTFFIFFNVSFLFQNFFVIYVIIFSHSINTHTGDYGSPTEGV